MILDQETRQPSSNLFGPAVSTAARRVHLIGIGGMALSGIAHVLLERGYRVSGSDISPSSYTDRLIESGAEVAIGHDSANVEDADAVIFSAAIRSDNPELRRAAELDVPILRRAEIVGRLMDEKSGVAVAGTHGKTTTTAMIALILDRSGLSPGYLIGADSRDLGGNARWGQGEHLVVEADEYDSAFLEYTPDLALITYVEPDHLDYFGSVENMVDAYRAFAGRVREGGILFIRNAGPLAKSVAAAASCSVVWLGDGGDWKIDDYRPAGWGSEFTVVGPTGAGVGVQLGVPGLHNAYNALAAIAAAKELGVATEASALTLGEFSGVDRRFQLVARARGISIVEEYSHHPTEVRVSVQAARNIGPKRLWVVFQPHLRGRTEDFLEDFARSFDGADRVTIAEIFSPSGREGDSGISGLDLANAIGGDATTFQPTLGGCLREIQDSAQDGDLILIMGAGDVNSLSRSVADWLQR